MLSYRDLKDTNLTVFMTDVLCPDVVTDDRMFNQSSIFTNRISLEHCFALSFVYVLRRLSSTAERMVQSSSRILLLTSNYGH